MNNDLKFWNKAASGYDKAEEKDNAVYDKILHEVVPMLNSATHLLDIGCGTGALHNRLSPLVEHIDGLDYSGNMIKLAQDKARTHQLHNTTYYCGTLPHDDLSGKTYDAVTTFYLLHLIKDLKMQLIQINKALKKGGYFISVTPCMAETALLGSMIGLLGSVGIFPKITRYRHQDLAKAIEDAGFECIEIKAVRASTHEYMIIARKK